MKKNNPIYKIILSTIFIILVSVLITFVIILPSVNYINNIKKEIKTTTDESSLQYQKVKLLKKSISELSAVRENAKQLENSLVNKDDAVTIIKNLEDLATSKNIEQSLSISSGSDNNFIFSFKTKASFYKTLQYLNTLEHLPFYTTLDDLSWSKVDENNVSLSFKATVFTK